MSSDEVEGRIATPDDTKKIHRLTITAPGDIRAPRAAARLTFHDKAAMMIPDQFSVDSFETPVDNQVLLPEHHEFDDGEESVLDSSDDETDWWDGVYGTRSGESMDKEEALIDACKDNELDTVLELIGNDFQKSEVDLDCRIPMNHPNHPMYSRKRRSVMFEDSAFQICCTRGHEELVTYFINREEMNFRTTDMENMTPLHGSVSNDHLNIVKLLVKSQRVGNMLNERDRAGRTPMYLAAQLGLFEVLRFFATQTFRKKADFEAATVDGMTPLWIAARNGHFTCVKMLIEKGANIEHANKKDMRVLHAAVMSRDCKLVDYLVNEAGCELNAVDETNRTPFYLAAQNEQADMVEMISLYDGIDMKVAYAASYTGQESALAKNNREIGFYIRDLQRQRDKDKKDRIEAANNAMGKKNAQGKKKTLLSEDEWAVAKEFVKGRNLVELDGIPFKSWESNKLDWVKKEHDVKEMRTKEKNDKLERARKAREAEEELEEQRERNGGKTDAELEKERLAKANRRLSVSERRASVSKGKGKGSPKKK